MNRIAGRVTPGRNSPQLPAAPIPQMKRHKGSSSGGSRRTVNSLSLFELALKGLDYSVKISGFYRGIVL